MHININNQRPGPAGRYPDESGPHPRPRDVFHPEDKLNLWQWAPVPGDAPNPEVPPPLVAPITACRFRIYQFKKFNQ